MVNQVSLINVIFSVAPGFNPFAEICLILGLHSKFFNGNFLNCSLIWFSGSRDGEFLENDRVAGFP